VQANSLFVYERTEASRPERARSREAAPRDIAHLISHARRGQPEAGRRGEGYFSNPCTVDANAGTGITRSSIKPYAQRVHECRSTHKGARTRAAANRWLALIAYIRAELSMRALESIYPNGVSNASGAFRYRSSDLADRAIGSRCSTSDREARPRMTLARHAFRPRVLRYEASYKASYIAAVGARARGAAIKSLLIESFDRTAFERGDASATLPNKNTVNSICPPTLPRRGSSIDRESKAASAKRHGARMHKASFHARAYLARKAVS